MNLQNILAIMGIVLFVISMVRGCGGMMSGGCGTGSQVAISGGHMTNKRKGADMKQPPEPFGIKVEEILRLRQWATASITRSLRYVWIVGYYKTA